MDHLTKERRSWNMSRIRSKDTAPEKIVRSFLHERGFRFRVCVKDLPGKPDIVLSKYKTVIQVRGCFWHRHKGCPKATVPKTNLEYWNQKFENNIKRDKKEDEELQRLGWALIVIWECQIKNKGIFLKKLSLLLNRKEMKTDV